MLLNDKLSLKNWKKKKKQCTKTADLRKIEKVTGEEKHK